MHDFTVLRDLVVLGAGIAIPEKFETSIEIFARILRLYGVPGNVIERDIEAVRGGHYELLRGLSFSELKLQELGHPGDGHSRRSRW